MPNRGDWTKRDCGTQIGCRARPWGDGGAAISPWAATTICCGYPGRPAQTEASHPQSSTQKCTICDKILIDFARRPQPVVCAVIHPQTLCQIAAQILPLQRKAYREFLIPLFLVRVLRGLGSSSNMHAVPEEMHPERVLIVIEEKVVGAARFELTTPCTQNRCATRLRHAPTLRHRLTAGAEQRNRCAGKNVWRVYDCQPYSQAHAAAAPICGCRSSLPTEIPS